jgi:hypothetical protein
MENDAQLRSSARFEVRFPRRQKLRIFGVLIDQSPSSPVRGLGSPGRMTTMATAVCASAKHAISYQFSACAKPKGLLGQSRKTPNAKRQTPNAKRQTPNAKRQTLTAIQALVVPFVMRINGATIPTAIAATIRRQVAANASVSVTRAVAAAAPVCTI